MRPFSLGWITQEGGHFVGGNQVGGAGIDQIIQTNPRPNRTVQQQGLAGWGPCPAYGTFIDQGSQKYGFVRFFKAAPQLVVQLRNEQFGPVEKAVTAPMTLKKQPGYVDDVPYATTAISRMINKGYQGAPVQ